MEPEELNIEWIDGDEFIIADLKIKGIWYSGTLDVSEEDNK